MKLEGDLSAVLYVTALKGMYPDRAADLAVDAFGRAHVVGTTQSRDFPALHPLQRPMNGSDAFVAALDAAGTLTFSTHLGAGTEDSATGIAVDATGSVYVVGNTGYGSSRDNPRFADFPTVRALQRERRNTTFQGFLSKIGLP